MPSVGKYDQGADLGLGKLPHMCTAILGSSDLSGELPVGWGQLEIRKL